MSQNNVMMRFTFPQIPKIPTDLEQVKTAAVHLMRIALYKYLSKRK
jgi:hypothetical protein